jgi:hypothetical protein
MERETEYAILGGSVHALGKVVKHGRFSMGGWLTGFKTRVTVWLNALCSSNDQHTDQMTSIFLCFNT